MDVSDFEEALNGNKVLLKHRDLLKTLSDDRIMLVYYNDDGSFSIMECCDGWFYRKLAKEECVELSEMFKEIAEAIGT